MTTDTSRENLSILLDVLRAGIQRENANAERLDAKTRQLLALVGVIYAIVQTVAFGSYRQGHLGGGERLAIAVSALLAVGLLAIAILASFNQQRALEVAELDLEEVGAIIEEPARPTFLAQLCGDHLSMLWSRREANFKRRMRLRAAATYSVGAVVVIAGELGIAVVARIS